MSKYLVVLLLIISMSSSGQSLERSISDKWIAFSSKPTNNASEQLNKGSFKGAKWSIDKITTERGYKWVQLKVVWTAKSWSLGDSKLSVDKDMYGFIAKDTLELEGLCKRIEESFGIRIPEGNINSYVYIGKVKSVYKNKMFYINYNYKRGNETGYPLKKGPALELVKFLREQYQYFMGYDQPAGNCINLLVEASDAFDRGDYEESEAIYAKLTTMNCRQNMNTIIAKYGACLTHTEKYQQAIAQYEWINDEYKTCKACHEGYFYFESGLVKMNYLNDNEGALSDINKAIAYKETSARLRGRAALYQKMNLSEKADEDSIYAHKLDSLFYRKYINRETVEINKNQDTTATRYAYNLSSHYKKRAHYYKEIRMYEESKQDSLKSIKYNKITAVKDIKRLTQDIEENKYPKLIGDKYYERAQKYDITEQFSEAKLDYEKALEIKPNYGLYLVALSKHFMLSNQLKRAMETTDLVLNAHPESNNGSYHSPAYGIKARIYLKQNDKVSACEMYQKILGLGGWDDQLRLICRE